MFQLVFRNGVEHCNNIFRRHVRLDVVYLLENEPSMRHPCFKQVLNMFYNFCRRTAGEHVPRVTSTTPKGNPVAKSLLQM